MYVWNLANSLFSQFLIIIYVMVPTYKSKEWWFPKCIKFDLYLDLRPLLRLHLSKFELGLVYLWFYVTVKDTSVIYVMAHRCAGCLKKKVDIRSGSQRHRHFMEFFKVPIQHLAILPLPRRLVPSKAQLDSNSQPKDDPYPVSLDHDNGQIHCTNGVKTFSRLLQRTLVYVGKCNHSVIWKGLNSSITFVKFEQSIINISKDVA